MGKWWIDTVSNPSEEEERSVTFKGDPKALPKRWPILWRYCQNWHVLKVARSGAFRLYFRSANGQCMKYRWPIYSDYVAVRVGSEEVTFWAVSDMEGYDLKIADTGVWVPGRFRKDTRTGAEGLYAHRLSKRAEFV